MVAAWSRAWRLSSASMTPEDPVCSESSSNTAVNPRLSPSTGTKTAPRSSNPRRPTTTPTSSSGLPKAQGQAVPRPNPAPRLLGPSLLLPVGQSDLPAPQPDNETSPPSPVEQQTPRFRSVGARHAVPKARPVPKRPPYEPCAPASGPVMSCDPPKPASLEDLATRKSEPRTEVRGPGFTQPRAFLIAKGISQD